MIAIIIGAGPSGLVCAIGLSSCCEQVHLIEKYPTFDKRGSTFGLAFLLAISELSPECLDDMQRIGMKAGETLVFIWYEFRDALLRCAKERSNIIKIHCGEEFTSIIDNGDDGVSVVCQSGLKLTGDFVVGADGVHSKVRDVLHLPLPLTHHIHRLVSSRVMNLQRE